MYLVSGTFLAHVWNNISTRCQKFLTAISPVLQSRNTVSIFVFTFLYNVRVAIFILVILRHDCFNRRSICESILSRTFSFVLDPKQVVVLPY